MRPNGALIPPVQLGKRDGVVWNIARPNSHLFPSKNGKRFASSSLSPSYDETFFAGRGKRGEDDEDEEAEVGAASDEIAAALGGDGDDPQENGVAGD